MIKNKTNGKILATKMQRCDSFFSRLRGLMFKKRILDEAYLFVLKKESVLEASIHMLFVFFPIDVAWLDKNFKVVDFKQSIAPFSLYHAPKKPAKYVLELPERTIKKTKTKIGDLIKIKYS